MMSVLLLGLPLYDSAPPSRARIAVSAKSVPFCRPFCVVLFNRSASLILYGRRPAGISAPSINTNSTVIAPWTLLSVSYGRGCSVRICDDDGPTMSSSMPTRPRPRNFGGSSALAPRSYTSNRISADWLDRSLRAYNRNKEVLKACDRRRINKINLTIKSVRPNMDCCLDGRPFDSFAVARPFQSHKMGLWPVPDPHLSPL